ncbi:phospho-sugar mutase [Homoserinibacter sp. YIM 151385]|uniref:phospho-sugar mutase n=1 Tax=Homoserinibacter sp. YIM 151385 TaxID=2985506 RepID=UPI0022F0A5EE|nr:phospho-sugar mutase [Homoserinibacter sp. YIM 151385]WBU36811.1 phospho-sugar mutase [Homoserinibacter sp. YIM 151385]
MSGTADTARSWLAQDPDPETRAELEQLLAGADRGDAEAAAALEARFAERLAFGTAGLRGELGAGPTRMNRVLVTQAAGGLAAHLLERAEQGTSPSIVIGWDGRRNSDVFAHDTARIMAGAGIRAILLPRLLPTPVLAYAVRALDASAGVMVTASHNPPRDNGYKVYLGGLDHGSQIVPPVDGEIAAHIAAVAAGDIRELPRSDDIETAPEAVVEGYIRETAALATHTAPLTVAYTAMHGVGWETASAAFRAAGFEHVTPVASQRDPDGAFPTVDFPNPEEPGAMDRVFALARELGADLALANDPDADRLAVGIPTDAADAEDGWQRLSGNQLGWLLGWRAARAADAAGIDGTLACSLVSSPALESVARAHGLDYVETLTGFKWISRAGGLRYGYEEALGYLVDPEKVRDKDGISAAVAVLDLAAELHADGRTIADALLEFAERFGGYASGQVSVRVTDLEEIPRTMARIRQAPPAEVGGVRVEAIEDFRDGFQQFPPSDLLRFRLEGGSRIIVRPSGTEPKVKVYLDAMASEGTGAERLAAAQSTVAALETGVRALLAG